MTEELDYAYEGSDESSESDLLERSLSVWKGYSVRDEHFLPVPLDLHTAASIGQYDSVRAAIERGDAALNVRNAGGWTALMYAAYIGHDNIVNLLLDAAVGVNVSDHKGRTPLMLAASCGNESVAYFLLQAGAELETVDLSGWTALFHATFSGHHHLVKFLLESGADTNTAEPNRGYTPLLEAVATGHNIIVQCFLQHGVADAVMCSSRERALAIAKTNGHDMIVNLITAHLNAQRSNSHLPGADGLDLSSSDEANSGLGSREKWRKSPSTGPNIQEGPEGLAQMMAQPHTGPVTQSQRSGPIPEGYVPRGYVTFREDSGGGAREGGDALRFRDVTAPITSDDDFAPDSPERGECEKNGDAFSQTGALTIKSGVGGSPGGLCEALGLSVSSQDSSDDCERGPGAAPTPAARRPGGVRRGRSAPMARCRAPQAGCQAERVSHPADEAPGGGWGRAADSRCEREAVRPCDLDTLLRQLGLAKYAPVFDEQDVDLQVFLSLTDNDLKEVGIKMLGPRRKMTTAIARWHSEAHLCGGHLERAYADRLEAEMQEMAIQLHQAYEQGARLKQHALQESELRSVAEALLMEGRVAWQHVCRLATQTRHHCCHLGAGLDRLRVYEEELAKRLACRPSAVDQADTTTTTTTTTTMTTATQPLTSDATEQPVWRLGAAQVADAMLECHKTLYGLVADNVACVDALLASARQAGTGDAVS